MEYSMQTSPQIKFRGIAPSAKIQDAVEEYLIALEQRWGRITACRVVLKGPGERHRKGGLYEIHIRLALPDGREVNVERTRRLMSGTPTWTLPSKTRSNAPAGSCKTGFVVRRAG
jgi:hypothetical protein